MINVIIVDDEQLMRTKLISLIDWEKHGFSLCGVFGNAKKALDYLTKNPSDIILSDMRMPEIDGLEFNTICKKQYPKIVFIALSSFDDFDYVKGTMQNGALDYILKHNLTPDFLLEVLERAKKSLGIAPGKTLSYSAINLIAVKQRFLLNLISNFYQNKLDIEYEIKSLNLSIRTFNSLCILMAIDDFHQITSVGIENTTLYHSAIINIVNEILEDSDNGAFCHYEQEKYIIILSFSNYNSESDFFIQTLLKRIQHCLKQFLNLSASFSIGPLSPNISKINTSFKVAQKNLEQKLYKGKNCIISISDCKNSFVPTMIGLDIEKEQKILAYIKSTNEQQLLDYIDEIFQVLTKEQTPLVNCQIIFNNMLNIISKVSREESIDSHIIFNSNELIFTQLQTLETLEDIRLWFIKLFQKLHNTIHNSLSISQYSEIVKKTILFLRNNYASDISLSQAAENIEVSSVYLSKLFKKETSLGFNDYLNNLRLEKAKILLIENNFSLKEISNLCGFNNYTYFFSVFKQNIGCTPKEFFASQQKS